MSILKPTHFVGTVTWLGGTRTNQGPLWSEPATEIMARFAGIEGEVHAGLTAPSCVRMVPQYAKGTEIRNTRQFSVLSAEEMVEIAQRMGLAELSPSLLGVTMVLRGIPDFSYIPPGSRLQAASGATLVVNLNNRPCTYPAKAIELAHPGFGKAFKSAAEHRRGIVGWVEREGMIRLGDEVRLHIPEQRPWKLLEDTLRE
ncbi:MAG: MOSC domain-containing protein [Candidatus Saccharibacteria bacterium]|nr:MOSC domain-containing protein [Pseudorhodobacter sp.]